MRQVPPCLTTCSVETLPFCSRITAVPASPATVMFRETEIDPLGLKRFFLTSVAQRRPDAFSIERTRLLVNTVEHTFAPSPAWLAVCRASTVARMPR